jgi:O-antigen/teichoic acid export membrane protein
MTGIGGKLKKGAAWIAASRALVNLLGFANAFLLARYLDPSDFGLVAIATTITTVIASVTELSLASALIQHKDPSEDHFHSAFTLNLARSILIAMVMLIVAAPVSTLYKDPRLLPVFFAIAIGTVLTGMSNPKLIVLSRGLVFWQEFATAVTQKLIGFLAAAVIAILFRSYWALVAGVISTQFAGLILSYLVVSYRPRFVVNRFRELFGFSVWISLAQAVNTLNWRFDHLIVGYFLGNTALGYYSVGDNLSVLPTREATTPIAQTLFPAFAMLRDEPARLRAAYQRGQSLLCTVALPVGFGFALIARPLVLVSMGARWEPAIFIIELLSGTLAIQTLASSVQPLAMALGLTRSLFNRDLVNLVMRIPLVILGYKFAGLPGIVIARCVSGVTSTLINMLMIKRLLDLSIGIQLRANARTFIATLFMLLTGGPLMFFLRSISFTKSAYIVDIGTSIICGSLIYSGSIYVLWVVAGRPSGPETEIGKVIKGLALKFFPK